MRLEKRILVVDDDDAIRALVTTVLRRRGLAIDTARHGAEAMEKIAGARYCLMILDLMMPLVSGYEVLDQIAMLSASRRPPVLVLTASLTPKVLDPSIVIGTIHKPFDIELLLDTVMACLAALTESTLESGAESNPSNQVGESEPN